ncbi:hypothetical protein C0W28_16895 [Photobacterium kishitanii]|nr:hypothetical protein C0W28_16895 [Photobacterium kishitanii]
MQRILVFIMIFFVASTCSLSSVIILRELFDIKKYMFEITTLACFMYTIGMGFGALLKRKYFPKFS